MGFDLFSPKVLDIQIWASFDSILEWRQNAGLRMGHNITILKNWSQKWINNPEKTTVIAFDLFIPVGILYTRLAPFWPNFHFMTSQGLLNFEILENDGRSNFSLHRLYMVPSFAITIVWSRYIALKLLWRIWENDVKEGDPFHTFLQIIYINFTILVSSYNLSRFVLIFKKIDEKLAHM